LTLTKESVLHTILPLLLFLSGGTALIYESLWMRSFGLIFGNTTYAVSVILSIFMAGLALGSFITVKLFFKRTLRIYAAVETGIGLSALITLPLLRMLPEWYGSILQAVPMPAFAELIVRIFLAGLIILPTTILIGMTFPVLTEFFTRTTRNLHANIGFLYRTNTLGAACGVVAVTFLLLPHISITRIFIITALINGAIGFTTWFLGAGITNEFTPQPSLVAPAAGTGNTPVSHRQSWIFVCMACVSGACSFGMELVWTRSMTLVIGSSLYSFNVMLIAFLCGIVIGTYIYERVWSRLTIDTAFAAKLFIAMGILICINLACIGQAPLIYFKLMCMIPVSFVNYQITGFLLCFASMFSITVLFGFTFPVLTHIVKNDLLQPQQVSGFLYLWNTIGSILGALVTGFALIPLWGIQTSYVCIASLALVSAGAILIAQLTRQTRIRILVACLILPVMITGGYYYKPWDRLLMTSGIYFYGVEWRDKAPRGTNLKNDLHSGRKILFYREGREGVVSVTQTDEHIFMAINGKIEGGNTRDLVTQKLVAHIPLMLHPDPQKVLVIGWGTGSTVGSACLHPALRSLVCAEIEPAMFEARSFFSPINFNADRDPRFTINFSDGRNMLLTKTTRFDVIISQPSNPWISGVSNLFTSDFYAIASQRLEKNGIFCQWFHYYNIGLAEIRIQFKTFCTHFPYISLWLIPPVIKQDIATLSGDMILIGSMTPVDPDYHRIQRMFAIPAIKADLHAIAVDDEMSFLCNYIMNRDEMKTFAADAILNTDDFPTIEMNAPKGLYYDKKESSAIEHSIHRAIASGSKQLLPPIRNYPPLSDTLSAKQWAALYDSIGLLCLRKALVDKACNLLEASLQHDENRPQTLLNLARIHQSLGETGKAVIVLHKALRLAPDLQEAYHILLTLYISRIQLNQAREIAARYMRLYPDRYWGYYGMALVDIQEKRWTQAKANLTRALTINPGFGNAKTCLNIVSMNLGTER
jgi:spermidine synthase